MGSYTSIGIGGSQNHIEKLAEPMYQRPQNRTVRILSFIIMSVLSDILVLSIEERSIFRVILFTP